MKAVKRAVEIEFFTFEEFCQLGRELNPQSINDGFAWSFNFRGHSITHENNECYIIPTLEGSMRFTPEDVLIVGVKGEIYPCKTEIFNMTYDVLDTSKKEETFEDRLVKEFNELKDKGWKLHDFINSDKFTTIVPSERQRNLLEAQSATMNAYLHVLAFRLEDLGVDSSRWKFKN